MLGARSVFRRDGEHGPGPAVPNRLRRDLSQDRPKPVPSLLPGKQLLTLPLQSLSNSPKPERANLPHKRSDVGRRGNLRSVPFSYRRPQRKAGSLEKTPEDEKFLIYTLRTVGQECFQKTNNKRFPNFRGLSCINSFRSSSYLIFYLIKALAF